MDLQDIMRKYFRISVRDNDAVAIKINDVPYDMLDVGSRGIGVRLTAEDIFFSVGDKLPVQLKIEGKVHDLEGTVVHISPAGPVDYLCGIEFTDIDAETKVNLMNYLQTCREKIFKEV